MIHGRRFSRRKLRRPLIRGHQIGGPNVGPGIAGTGRGPARGLMVFTPKPGTPPRRWRHPLNYTPVQNYFRRHTHGY